jgi:hypothetical protein
MSNPLFAVFGVATRALIPSTPIPGTLYFVRDEGVILGRHSDGTYREYGGTTTPGGASVIDNLSGSQIDAAPSVRAVKVALANKADILSGKLNPSLLPDLSLMYRGTFAEEAALNAAHSTDEIGAYASVIVAGIPSLYVCTGTAWVKTDAASVSDLDGKEDKSAKGEPDGYAGLDANSKVPVANLPEATTTVKGIMRPSSDAEVAAGTSTETAVTPKQLKALANTIPDGESIPDLSDKGEPYGYAGLDANAKVPAANLPEATTTIKGIVRLSTDAEVTDGTDTETAVSPKQLKDSLPDMSNFPDMSDKGQANGYAGLDANAKVPAANLPEATTTVKGIVRLSTDAEVEDGTDTKTAVSPKQLQDSLYGVEMTSERGMAEGYAGLDADGVVPDANLPDDLERTTNKGEANGYAPLDSNAKVPSANLPAPPEIPDVSALLSKSGGTMTGALVAQDNADYTTAQARNIAANTTDLTAGTSELASGQVYLVYE